MALDHSLCQGYLVGNKKANKNLEYCRFRNVCEHLIFANNSDFFLPHKLKVLAYIENNYFEIAILVNEILA